MIEESKQNIIQNTSAEIDQSTQSNELRLILQFKCYYDKQENFQITIEIWGGGENPETSLMNGFILFLSKENIIEQRILWKDLLGAEGNISEYKLAIFQYSLKPQGFFNKESRQLKQFNLYFDPLEKNVSKQLRKQIIIKQKQFQVRYQSMIQAFSQNDIKLLKNLEKSDEYLIQRSYQQQQTLKEARVMLKKFGTHGYQFKELLTLYRYHTQDYILELNTEQLLSFDGIVAVGGDGMVFEIVNGLLLREDRDQVKHIPIGHIPDGSGNALSSSIQHKSGIKHFSPENAAFLIAKAQTIHMDIMELERIKQQPLYTCLALTWCFLADVDIESESMRFLGESRFTLYGAYRVLNPKIQRGRLTYTSEENQVLPPLGQQIQNNGNWKVIEQNIQFLNMAFKIYIIYFLQKCNNSYLKLTFQFRKITFLVRKLIQTMDFLICNQQMII